MFESIFFFSCQNICKAKQIKLPEDDWLVKNNSFQIGDFIFMLNTDWMAKKQLNVYLINHGRKTAEKAFNRNQNSIIQLYKLSDLIYLNKLTDLTLDRVFHTSIIAYCQHDQYVRLAIYTDLFTLNI